MNRLTWFASVLVVSSASVGCATTSIESSESSEKSEKSDSVETVGTAQATIAGDGASTYYIVTRPDTRRCAYPMCGGSFVKRLSRLTTRCADGVYRQECHMANLDLSAIGLLDSEGDKFKDIFAQKYGIVRGSLESVESADASGLSVDTLKASEAWVTASLSAPTGNFYGLSSSGIVCITFPCPTIFEEELNSTSSRNIHDLDLTGVGASDRQIAEAMALLSGPGILAAGVHKTFTGPGGSGTQLVATQFYTQLMPTGERACGGKTFPVNPPCEAAHICDPPEGMCGAVDIPGTCRQVGDFCAEVYQPVCGCDGMTYGNNCERLRAGVALDHEGKCDGGVKCGDNTCGEGYYCCNASCGMCAREGMSCIQIACD